jgi:cysteine desulfurase
MTENKQTVYLDYAATTPLGSDVLECMLPYLTACYGNADSPHALGRKALAAVDTARDSLAALIGAKPSEVYFTSGGTEADNWGIIGGARAQKRKGKTKIVISAIEHHAALHAAETLQQEGFVIEYLPVNSGGRVQIESLEQAIDENTALVCLMAVNNETGVIQPIKEMSALARKMGALLFVDGVQAAPHIEIDVKAWGVDMLSLSAHKFYGPKGVGALYIKSGVRIEKLIGGGEQERGLRGGTSNVAAIVGLSAAYQKARTDMEKNEKQLAELSAYFMQQLREKTAKIDGFAGLVLNGEGEEKLPSVCNVRFIGVENTALLFNLDLQGVCVAAGSACASASIKPSHVLTAMGLDERAAKECIRFSFGKENTKAQIDYAVDKIVQTVKQLVKKA